MSINSLLKAALDPIAPVEADVYEGNKEIYVTFSYDTIPDDFGDDQPGHERILVHVYLHAPIGRNTLRERRAVKRALTSVGMTWPVYTNASDEKGQHHVFSCETAREAGDE